MRFDELKTGTKVRYLDAEWLVTDQTRSYETAWEHWRYDEKLLVNLGTGATHWVSEQDSATLCAIERIQ